MKRRHRLGSAPGRVAAVMVAAALMVAPTTPAAAQQGDWWYIQLQLEEVWQITDGAGVTVAILDSGVDSSTPELAGAVLTGDDMTGAAPDGQTDHDPDAHGTHMGLLVAGNGEVTGLPGVAPAATILPVATLTPERPAEVDIVDMEAIRYAVDNGAHVINISIATTTVGEAGTTCPRGVADAIRYAISNDVVVVAGAGNLASGPTAYPASCPGALTVGAVDQHGQPWDRTHRSRHVDIAAPGAGIDAPAIGGTVRTTNGTSNSAALVSGVLALLRAHYPDASANDLVTRLLATAQDVGEPGRDNATGHGIVQPLAALTATIPPDAPNPVYEPLGDLTNVPPPTAAPVDEAGAPERAVAAPPSADDGGGGTPLPIVLAVAVVLLAGAAGAFALLGLRARRRRDPGDGDG